MHNTYKKNALKPLKVKSWVIQSEQDAEFVAHIEQVLDVYKRPYDEDFPVFCMDEIGLTSINSKPISSNTFQTRAQ